MALLLAGTQSFAQYQKGDKIVNLGIGLASLGLNVSGEYLINDQIGVGAYVTYERWNGGYYYSTLSNRSRYSRNEISVGARGAFHAGKLLNLDSKFDPYVAAGAGLYFYNDPYYYYLGGGDYNSRTYVGPSLLLRIGGRYYFKESTAVFGELGTGGSWIQGGISFKF